MRIVDALCRRLSRADRGAILDAVLQRFEPSKRGFFDDRLGERRSPQAARSLLREAIAAFRT